MASAAPSTIGKYRIEREIGRGASATVYLGFDPFHGRRVAVKQIHPHLLLEEAQAKRYRRMLRNEALLAGQLRHPHIVRLLDADEDADPPYLVLEYIDGVPLQAFVARDRLLPVAQVLDIAYKCCRALEHARSKGLVHRDIKPANLILLPNGDLKVTDFGMAFSATGEMTQLTGMVGSPCYMSPEQVREEDCTYHSDMFSLAVVMYEMLSGRRPFDGDSDYATLYKISSEEPAPLGVLRASLPPELDAAIRKAMAKKPQDRYEDWGDFADALLAVNRAMPKRAPNEREGERFAQMRKLGFFGGFNDAALWEALRLGSIGTYSRGTALMREGDPGDSFCVLLEGRVAVSRHAWKLITLEAGVTLGEMSYLQKDNPVRSATAVAETDVVVLEIRNDALRQASEELQACFDKAFIQLLVNRLITTNEQVGNWDIGDELSGEISGEAD
jgi:tRNA A-37 threonylcarbamoyl transferase component Bud32